MINLNTLRYYKKRLFRKVNFYKGSIQNNLIKAYWYDKVSNFGDFLTPELLKSYGYTPINCSKSNAQLLLIGSILDDVSENFSGIILGSGLLYDQPKYLPHAKILAVRGKLTREKIGAPENVMLGDPGLLVDKLIRRQRKKRYRLGVVLHYMDQGDERINRIKIRYHSDVRVINVSQKIDSFIKNVDQCEHIISSSLHGIITAHSLEIPSAWIYLSDKVLGHGFKFRDYASAFDTILEPNYLDGSESLSDLVKMTQPVPDKVEQLKDNFDYAFQNLGALLGLKGDHVA